LLPERPGFWFWKRGVMGRPPEGAVEKDQGRCSSTTAEGGTESLFDVPFHLGPRDQESFGGISTFAALLPEKYDDPGVRIDFPVGDPGYQKDPTSFWRTFWSFAQFLPPRRRGITWLLCERYFNKKKRRWPMRRIRLTLNLKEFLPAILLIPTQLDFVLRSVLKMF